MQFARAAAVAGLLLGLAAAPVLLAPHGGAAAATPTDDANGTVTVTGAVLPPADEVALLAAADRNVTLPANASATRLLAPNGSYILVTERPVPPGLATVQGTVAGGNRAAPPVLVAESVSVRTRGDAVSFEALDRAPGRYERRLVSFRANVSVASALRRAGEGPSRTVGHATRGAPAEPPLRWPGRAARAVVFGRSLPPDPARRVAAGDGFELLTDRPLLWARAPATVDAVVLPNRSLAVAALGYRGRALPGSDAARTRPNLTGTVVTFETRLAGRRASARDAMLAADRCEPNAATRDDSCVPLDGDVALHAGVLFGGGPAPDTRSETLPYAGLSAAVPNETVAVGGRYRVTGRVVDSDAVDPRLPDGRALVLYDAVPVSEGTGADANTVVPPRVDRWAGLTLDLLRSQVTMTETEWSVAVTATREFVTDEDPPAGILVERARLPERVDAGAPIEVAVTLNNTGDSDRSVVLELREGETVYDVANVTVPAGATREVTLRFAVYEPGRHELTLNGAPVGVVRVDAVQTITATDGQSGFGPAVALLALLVWAAGRSW